MQVLHQHPTLVLTMHRMELGKWLWSWLPYKGCTPKMRMWFYQHMATMGVTHLDWKNWSTTRFVTVNAGRLSRPWKRCALLFGSYPKRRRMHIFGHCRVKQGGGEETSSALKDTGKQNIHLKPNLISNCSQHWCSLLVFNTWFAIILNTHHSVKDIRCAALHFWDFLVLENKGYKEQRNASVALMIAFWTTAS